MNRKEFALKKLEYKEHNDCAVTAVAVACAVSYEKAHAALKEAGRKNRGRCWFDPHCKPAIEALGFEVIEETFPGKTLVTLERDLQRYARGRKFFITVRNHFVAFNGEQIVDWAQGSRHHIGKVYRVRQVNTVQQVNTMQSGTVTGRFWGTVTPEQIEELPRNIGPINEDLVPNWLRDMTRPQGAPKMGERITQTIANNETYTGEVSGYLAAQFIIKMDGGRERIVAVGDEWKLK